MYTSVVNITSVKKGRVCFLAHPVYDHREDQQILVLLNIPKYWHMTNFTERRA